MKRTIAFLLTFLLCLNLCACGGDAAGAAHEDEAEASESVQEDTGFVGMYEPDVPDETEPTAESQVLTLVSQKRTYAPDGEMTSTIDYTYDKQGNLIKQILWSKSSGYYRTIEYSYNKNGLLIRESVTCTFAGSYTIIYTYNEDGLCAEETTITSDSEQITAVYTYDSYGNILSVEHPGRYTDFYTYNADNQLILLTTSDGDYKEYAYDDAGRLISIMHYDLDGYLLVDKTKEWEYYEDCVIEKQQHPLGECHIITYDLQGNALSLCVTSVQYTYEYHYEYDFIEITVS